MPHQFLSHANYVELRLTGVIDSFAPLADDEERAVQSAGRILIDYSGVERWDVDPYALVPAARENDRRGIRIAVYAPQPVLFGINRQILQLAGAREGETVCVFTDRAEAEAWIQAA
jgi:hypothetical protein